MKFTGLGRFLPRRSNPRPSASTGTSSLHLAPMEPRVLLSADFGGGVFDGDDHNDHDQLDVANQEKLLHQLAATLNLLEQERPNLPPALDLNRMAALLVADDDADLEIGADEIIDSLSAAEDSRLELVFVDSDAADYEDFIADLENRNDGVTYQVFVLDGNSDGIDQISSILSGFKGVDAIHIVSHGENGTVKLGNTWLDADNLDNYSAQFSSWQQFTDINADLLFYGCDLGGSAAGLNLLNALTSLTAMDIAASNDLTGAQQFGGDWDLEVKTGAVETDIAFSAALQENWNHVLLPPSVSAAIADVTVTQGGADSVINLLTVFTDPDTNDADLVYSVTANTNSGLFTSVTLDQTANTLTLDFADLYGTSDITVTASDGGASVTDTFTVTVGHGPILLLTTQGDASTAGGGGAATGITSWTEEELVQLGDPGLSLGATTAGQITSRFNLGSFTGGDIDTDIDAIHVVSKDITIGTIGQIALKAGDLLLSVDRSVTVTGADSNSLGVNNEDIFVFRPTNPGNHTAGNFFMLFDDLARDGSKIKAISLVEKDTVVGDKTLSAGTFLYGKDQIKTPILFTPLNLGALGLGAIGTHQNLYDPTEERSPGNPIMSNNIHGIEFIETAITIGGITLSTGDIVLSISNADTVMNNGLSVQAQDLFAVTFTTTTLVSGVTDASASLLLQGNDIGLTTAAINEEKIHGVSIQAATVANVAPTLDLDANNGTATGNNFAVTFTEGVTGAVTIVDTDVAVGDVDDTNIESATVTLTNAQTADVFIATGFPQNGISASVIGNVVTLSGSSSLANYQTALQAITFNNTSSTPNTTDRSITIVVNDGDTNSATATTTVTVNATNEPTLDLDANNSSTVTGNNYAVTFTEGVTGAVAIADADVTILDADDINIERATITLTNAQVGDVLLSGATPGGIDVDAASTSTQIILTGSAKLKHYETALRTMLFNNTSNTPNITDRNITIVINDGTVNSATATTTITVNATNDAPSLDLDANNSSTATGNNFAVTFTEDVTGAVVIVDTDVAVGDVDDTNIESATITLTNAQTGDVFIATGFPQNGISASVAGNVVTLSGSSTLANYQTALKAITFNNPSEAPSTTVRSISIVVNDGDDNSATATTTVTVNGTNDGPTLDLDANNSTVGGNNFAVTFTEDVTGAVAIVDTDVAVGDIDDTNIETATITLTNAQTGDVFIATGFPQNGISASVAGNVVMLSGSSTLTNYQTALKAITFNNTSDTPNTTTRSISIVVNDGDANSATATTTVTVVATNDAPTLDLDANNSAATGNNFAVTFTEDVTGAVVIVDTDVAVGDVDDTNIETATITLTNAQTGDTFIATGFPQNGISASVAGNVVTLSGSSTLANYQTALKAITFNNTSDTPNITARSITIVVNDGDANSTTATTTVTVVATNDAPTAASNTITILEDTPRVFTVADFNFSDIEGVALGSIRINSMVTNGALTLNGLGVALNQIVSAADISAGKLIFTPDDNENGANNASFSFVVSDGGLDAVVSSLITIDVTAVNDAPSANNQSVSFPPNSTYTFNATDFNFTDADAGDVLTSIQITSLESNGRLTLNGADVVLNQVISNANIVAGQLQFIPVANADGNNHDSFGFTLSDGSASSPSVTMTVNLNNNSVPTTSDNLVTILEDATHTFGAGDFNFVDSDVGDVLASIEISSLTTNGTMQLGGVSVTLGQTVSRADLDAGNLKYNTASNVNGASDDSFQFRVTDNLAGSSLQATLTFDVTAVNDLPTGTLSISGTGKIGELLTANTTFISDADSLGSFNYEWQNNGVAIAGATNPTYTVTAADIGQNITIKLSYTDGDGTLETLTSAPINPGNTAPTSSSNTVTATEDTAFIFGVADFNYVDPEGDALASVRINDLSTKGSLQLNGSNVTLNQVISRADISAGNLSFIPTPNANGAAYTSFGFVVNDGSLDAAAGSILTIDVTAVNDAPNAQNESISTPPNTTYVFKATDFNFVDVDAGDSLANIQITSLENVGQLTLGGVDVTLNQTISKSDIDSGLLQFVPLLNASGNNYDSFGFALNDGSINSASALMNINLNNNNAPTASNGLISIAEDAAYTFAAVDFNFADVDAGDFLASVAISSLPDNGQISLNGSAVTMGQVISATDIDAGNLLFQPAANDNGAGADSFQFRVIDSFAESSVNAALSFGITAVNDSPTGDVTIIGEPKADSVFSANTTFINDVDGLGVFNYQWQANGVDISGAATATYTVATADTGKAIRVLVSYTDQDGTLESLVSVPVNIALPDNQAPTASAIADVVVDEDSGLATVITTGAFTDPDGDTLSLTLSSVSNTGLFSSVSLNANGDLTFTPEGNAFGDAVVTLTAVDTSGESATTSFTIIVQPVNDAPVGGVDTGITDEDTVLSVSAVNGVLSNDADMDLNDSLSVVQVTNGGLTIDAGGTITGSQGGQFQVLADGAFNFDPGQDFQQLKPGEQIDTQVIYVVQDQSGEGVSVSLTVTVMGANDASAPVSDTGESGANTVRIVDEPEGLLSNDTDIDGTDTLTVVEVTNGTTTVGPDQVIRGDRGGSYTVKADGSYVFDPGSDFILLQSGSVQSTSVTYTVMDSSGDRRSSTLNINVTGSNIPTTTTSTSLIASQTEPEPPVATTADPTPEPEPETEPEPEPEPEAEDEEGDPDTTSTDGGTPQSGIDSLLDGGIIEIDGPSDDTTLDLQGGESVVSQLTSLTSSPIGINIASFAEVSLQSVDVRSSLGLIGTTDSLILIGSPDYNRSLDESRDDADQLQELSRDLKGGSVSVTAGISIGYVIWLVRSGVIMSSVLSAMPAWRLIDPLPILSSLANEDEDGESIEDIVQSLDEEPIDNEIPALNPDMELFSDTDAETLRSIDTDISAPKVDQNLERPES